MSLFGQSLKVVAKNFFLSGDISIDVSNCFLGGHLWLRGSITSYVSLHLHHLLGHHLICRDTGQKMQDIPKDVTLVTLPGIGAAENLEMGSTCHSFHPGGAVR